MNPNTDTPAGTFRPDLRAVEAARLLDQEYDFLNYEAECTYEERLGEVAAIIDEAFRKPAPNDNGGEQYHTSLAGFGLCVLRTMENDEDWGGDTLEAIRDASTYFDLAGDDEEGCFRFKRCPVCKGERDEDSRGPECPGCGEE